MGENFVLSLEALGAGLFLFIIILAIAVACSWVSNTFVNLFFNRNR